MIDIEEKEEFVIIFYKKDDGSEPAKEFLDGLDNKMRAKVSTDITRVLYFFVSGRKAILTHGFVKKTQKTPQSEIEKAENYRRDYLSKNKS